EIDRLGTGARVTIVVSGERPSVLLGPAALSIEARSALDTWKPAAPDHPLALGVRLARELAGRTGRLMVVSDLAPAPRGQPELEAALWGSVRETAAHVRVVRAGHA